ncbi:hypothetical protein ACFL3V_04115 [Nanoarchaeota archaeon]
MCNSLHKRADCVIDGVFFTQGNSWFICLDRPAVPGPIASGFFKA